MWDAFEPLLSHACDRAVDYFDAPSIPVHNYFGDHLVASDLPIDKQDALAGHGATDNHYELAQADYVALQAPIERPGPEAFDNPKGYLQYLKYKISSDIDTLTELNTKSIETVRYPDGHQETVDPSKTSLMSWINEYQKVLDSIDQELHRLGGPRASELGRLYNDAASIRKNFGLA